jgi:membrane protein implicated in regulation of membrane protease activity
MAFGIIAGAMTAIVSQIVLTEYRYWREDKREEEKRRRDEEAKARGEIVPVTKTVEEEEE